MDRPSTDERWVSMLGSMHRRAVDMASLYA